MNSDFFYIVTGACLLILTLQPFFTRYRWSNFPLLYILIGVSIALLGLPVIYPFADKPSAKLVEHTTELIVIISLAGAGIAIDAKPLWRRWKASYLLVLFAMPLTIFVFAVLGHLIFELTLASAVLLGACLAPTDPVLARTVSIKGPNSTESPLKLALTSEAGLNDGLAFPFVYLAIAIAAAGGSTIGAGEIVSWISFDLLYKVICGVAIGIVVGWLATKITLSRIGDIHNGAKNSVVFILALTLCAYGVAELVKGYGFLAVFVAAYVSGSMARETSKSKDTQYEHEIHEGADQLEKILLVLVIVWFGTLIGDGILAQLSWREWLFALLAIFVVRPACAYLPLLFMRCGQIEKVKVAFFGVRGIGTVFYLSYAQNRESFDQLDTLWKTVFLIILLSVIIHGFFANFAIEDGETNAR